MNVANLKQDRAMSRCDQDAQYHPRGYPDRRSLLSPNLGSPVSVHEFEAATVRCFSPVEYPDGMIAKCMNNLCVRAVSKKQ
jgi:hypothetical protein